MNLGRCRQNQKKFLTSYSSSRQFVSHISAIWEVFQFTPVCKTGIC
ncbi:unnamed protein product [Notodromas monacha]|uniref:Uncharacterized protein n=1 Tax=Notodromas monacha TaxID=399045 RepID=A0A7R9GKF0_9CRUS|nr:unnamed protein product [Notodromas monacha]CAG0925830.1 unnamed protein product [Notodromas monacha]